MSEDVKLPLSDEEFDRIEREVVMAVGDLANGKPLPPVLSGLASAVGMVIGTYVKEGREVSAIESFMRQVTAWVTLAVGQRKMKDGEAPEPEKPTVVH